jgi:putative transposase
MWYGCTLTPNHFHGIVFILNIADDLRRGDRPVAPTTRLATPAGPQSKSLGAFIGGFKCAVTTRINSLRQMPGTPVWQRNYYEHIIRNEADYQRIAEYIDNNPRRWTEDSLNPMNVGDGLGRGDRPVAPTDRTRRSK